MKIGRYTVGGLLGRGGMGAVYKVRQPVTGRIAALKLLKPTDILEDLVGMDELARQFEQEAKMMAALDHPNIAAVWDYDEADGKPFFVMEYYCRNLGMLIGESYRVEAPTRRLPLDKAVSYASQTLDALARMHHAGIIHRDVKPFNIMLAGEGPELTVKLIDFGLSRLRGETRLAEALAATSVQEGHDAKDAVGKAGEASHGTQSGMPAGVKIGSPYYAPPEQETAPDSVDGRADCYPVAVMLYRMLTGILPNDEEILADASLGGEGNIPPSSKYSEDLDDKWDAFFARALAPDPADRFADARTMQDELARLQRRWEAKLANVCALMDEEERPPCPTPDQSLRTGSVKVGVNDAQNFFALDDLWRPLCRGPREFVVQDARPAALPERTAETIGKAVVETVGQGVVEVVVDVAAKRMWQQSGSDYALTWEEGHDYIDMLNETAHGGYTDWRLPTVAELSLLLDDPPMLGGFCVASAFDPAQEIVWTCDRKSYMAAWFVCASLGFVGWQDTTCRFHVRAVRTI